MVGRPHWNLATVAEYLRVLYIVQLEGGIHFEMVGRPHWNLATVAEYLRVLYIVQLEGGIHFEKSGRASLRPGNSVSNT